MFRCDCNTRNGGAIKLINFRWHLDEVTAGAMLNLIFDVDPSVNLIDVMIKIIKLKIMYFVTQTIVKCRQD